MQIIGPRETVWPSCESVLSTAGDAEDASDGTGGAAQAEDRGEDCHKDEEMGRCNKEPHTFRINCKPLFSHGNHDVSVCKCCY